MTDDTHMKRQIEFGQFVRIETSNGDCVLPADIAGTPHYQRDGVTPTLAYRHSLLQYLDVADVRDIWSAEIVAGYGARLSAPGYLDCTEWTVHGTEQDARDYLDAMYEDETDN